MGNTVTGVKYRDPVANVVDPVLDAAVRLCCIKGTQNQNGDFVPLTIVSAREMLLIRAEVALAGNNIPAFTGFINQIRAFNQLTPYAAPCPLAMLQHTRFVNHYTRRVASRTCTASDFGPIVVDMVTPFASPAASSRSRQSRGTQTRR